MKINQNEEVELLKVEILSLKKELVAIQIRNTNLVNTNNELESENSSIKQNFGNQLYELNAQREEQSKQNLNELLEERVEKTKNVEWETIINEMAHSINSDVYIAVSYLSRIDSNPDVKIALNHTKQIRDLINLIMIYLKRNVVKFSGNYDELSIKEVVNEQIETIKKSLSTLRLSTNKHEDSLQNIEIPIKVIGDTKIKIITEFKEAISIILKDLLRNAFKNTTEENPQIKIKIEKDESLIKLIIVNNQLISEDFLNWFNDGSEIEPEISKSSKVGLRVILKWTKLLGINAKFSTDKINKTTIAEIIFPKEIRYDK